MRFPRTKTCNRTHYLYFGEISRLQVPQGSTPSTQNLILSGTPYPKIPHCPALTYVSIFRYLYISYVCCFFRITRLRSWSSRFHISLQNTFLCNSPDLNFKRDSDSDFRNQIKSTQSFSARTFICIYKTISIQIKNPNTTDKDDPSNQMIKKNQQSVPNVLACSIK